MQPGASAEEVAAVVSRVEAAGGEAFVSSGVTRTIVGLVGDVEVFAGLNLRGMPGVGDVVRVSTAYKLVSRTNHPQMSTVLVRGVPQPTRARHRRGISRCLGRGEPGL